MLRLSNVMAQRILSILLSDRRDEEQIAEGIERLSQDGEIDPDTFSLLVSHDEDDYESSIPVPDKNDLVSKIKEQLDHSLDFEEAIDVLHEMVSSENTPQYLTGDKLQRLKETLFTREQIGTMRGIISIHCAQCHRVLVYGEQTAIAGTGVYCTRCLPPQLRPCPTEGCIQTIRLDQPEGTVCGRCTRARNEVQGEVALDIEAHLAPPAPNPAPPIRDMAGAWRAFENEARRPIYDIIFGENVILRNGEER